MSEDGNVPRRDESDATANPAGRSRATLRTTDPILEGTTPVCPLCSRYPCADLDLHTEEWLRSAPYLARRLAEAEAQLAKRHAPDVCDEVDAECVRVTAALVAAETLIGELTAALRGALTWLPRHTLGLEDAHQAGQSALRKAQEYRERQT